MANLNDITAYPEKNQIGERQYSTEGMNALLAEKEKLQRFKNYVHSRLDAAGVPKEPNGHHSAEGCRIGDRLDIVLNTPVWRTPDFIGDVTEFMLACGQARQVAQFCHLPPQNIRELRRTLIESEHKEFYDAWFAHDFVAIADALADMIYVIVGTAIAYGIPLDKVWHVVQEANMSKLWTWEQVCDKADPALRNLWPPEPFRGTGSLALGNGWQAQAVRKDGALPDNDDQLRYCVLNELGKVMKPPTWQEPEPRIRVIIEEAQRVPEQEETRRRWNETLDQERSTPSTYVSQGNDRPYGPPEGCSEAERKQWWEDARRINDPATHGE